MIKATRFFLFFCVSLLIGNHTYAQEQDWKILIDSAASTLSHDPQLVIELLQGALEKNDTLALPKLTGESHLLLGNAFYLKGKTDRSLYHSSRSVLWFETAGDSAQLARALNNLGALCRQQARYKLALEHFDRALSIKESLHDTRGALRTLTNIGNVYSKQGYTLSAMRTYMRALHLSDSLIETRTAATLRLNLGILLKEQSRYDEALVQYHKALRQFRNTANAIGIASSLTNIGAVYLQQNTTDSAGMYFAEALQTSEEANDLIGVGYALVNIGQTRLADGSPKLAIDPLQRALDIFAASNDRSALTETQYFLGEAYRRTGNLNKATALLTTAKNNSLTVQSLRQQIEAHRYFKKLLTDREQWKDALHIADSIDQWQSTLNENRQKQRIADLQTRFAIEEKEEEIQTTRLKLDRLKQERHIERLRTWLLLSIAGLTLLIALFIIRALYRKQKRKSLQIEISHLKLENARLRNENLQQTVEEKNEWLTRYALHLSEKNLFLQDILTEMKKPGDTNAIRQRIRQYLTSSKALEAYYEESNRLLADFRSKLLTQFPSLTEKDLRLCAFLRQGLTSKEIAGMLNISDKSVDIARHRLRKKLDIPREEAIDAFLDRFAEL